MNPQYMPPAHARLNTFYGPKRQLLGNQAGHAAPAWRTNVPPVAGHTGIVDPTTKGKSGPQEIGSKIFLSRLPVDVGEKEVEELFRKTVGPLKEAFIVYNSQGKSKGMAVVLFQRPGDAAIAKAKYDGKIVDGRRPLKIEVIVNGTTPTSASALTRVPSLLNRLSPLPSTPQTNPQTTHPVAASAHAIPPKQPRTSLPRKNQSILHPVATVIAPVPPRRIRHKKGPKRIKKQLPKTLAQLDKEMEDYRAAADTSGL